MARRKDGDGETARGGAKGARTLLIALLVLNLGAAGAYGYLKLKARRDYEDEVRRNVSALVSLKTDAENLRTAAYRIRSEQLQSITDPAGIIQNLAVAATIHDKIRVEKIISSRWKRSNYDEVVVPVHFKERTGYQWDGLVGFLTSIERQNPRIQIKAINFGTREEGEGEAMWRPLNMSVRVFTPRPSEG